MAESDTATERTQVVTYLPPAQKQAWAKHADELGMSQAEFVRTMVQAGRKGFELSSQPATPEGSSEPTNPGGDDLESRVLDVLHTEDVLSWDDLVEQLAGNFEDRLETALESLQAANRVRYRGREGGYTLLDE